jgi:hypothetical protein
MYLPCGSPVFVTVSSEITLFILNGERKEGDKGMKGIKEGRKGGKG